MKWFKNYQFSNNGYTSSCQIHFHKSKYFIQILFFISDPNSSVYFSRSLALCQIENFFSLENMNQSTKYAKYWFNLSFTRRNFISIHKTKNQHTKPAYHNSRKQHVSDLVMSVQACKSNRETFVNIGLVKQTWNYDCKSWIKQDLNKVVKCHWLKISITRNIWLHRTWAVNILHVRRTSGAFYIACETL